MKLKVTLVKSPISSIPNHVKIVKALGLRKVNHQKIHVDTPSIRGMLFKVKHLVRVEEAAESQD
jgi:large subunit ribosomal protein L30